MEAKLIKVGNHYDLYYRDEENDSIVGIASTDNTFELKLSLKNCQTIERGYDLDELAEKEYFDGCDNTERSSEIYRRIFKDGFQKALELMGDKKFSEEDVISMIEKSRETGLTAEYLILTKQQTEWDVFVERETVTRDFHGNISVSADFKLDADNCLILKLKSE